MITELLQTWQDQVPDLIAGLLTETILRQVAALVLLLALIPALRWLLQRVLARAGARLAQIPQLRGLDWIEQIFAVLSGALRSLSAWLLGQAALALFQALGWADGILDWALPLLLIWLLYDLASGVLRWRMPAERAEVWRHDVLRPLVIVVTLLHAIGVLESLLNVGFNLGADVRLTLGALLAGAIVFYVFLTLSRTVRRLLDETFLPRVGVEPAMSQVITTFVTYVIVVTGVFSALSIAGIHLTTLGFIAAGLSVGLGFGLQEVISNFVSGFILLFERSIVPGSVIQIRDVVGIVDEIGIRSTRVRTNDNIELIVPNSHFLSDVATNFTRSDLRVRIGIDVGVSYDAAPREVERALLQAAQHPNVLEEPAPKVQFVDFGDSSLDFRLLVWTDNAMGITQLSSDLRFNIWKALAAHQIEIPFPQRDLHIRTVSAAAAPLVARPEG